MKREHGVMQTPRRKGRSFRSKDSRASVMIHLPFFFFCSWTHSGSNLSLSHSGMLHNFSLSRYSLESCPALLLSVLPLTLVEHMRDSCLGYNWNKWHHQLSVSHSFPLPFLKHHISLSRSLCLHSWIVCASLFTLRVYIRFLGCYSHDHGQEITCLPPKVQHEGPFTCSTVRVTDTIAKFQGKTILLSMFWVFSFSPQVIEGNKMGRLFTKHLTSGFSFDTVLMCHMGMAPVFHWAACIYPAHMLWVLVWAAKCQLDDMHLKRLQTRVALFSTRDLCLKKAWTGEQSLNPLSVWKQVLLFYN